MNQGSFPTGVPEQFLLSKRQGFTVDLPDDVAALKAIILAQNAHNIRLEQLLAAVKQAMFGPKSEKINADQFELAFEDIETRSAFVEAEGKARGVAAPKSRKTNRGSRPKHLPRVEEVIDPDEMACACGSKRHVIGEEVSERLDIIPAQFRVIVTRRPK